jgi:hypothetical protein
MASSLSVFSRSGKRFTSSLKDGESPCFSKRSEDYIREMREAETLVEKIRYNGGVEIKTRSYHLRSYYACFIASELVDWLLQNSEATTRQDAVEIGQMLVRADYIHHVVDEHHFEDGYLFFRFRQDEPPSDLKGPTLTCIRGQEGSYISEMFRKRFVGYSLYTFGFSPSNCLLYQFRNELMMTPMYAYDLHRAAVRAEAKQQHNKYTLHISMTDKKTLTLVTSNAYLQVKWLEVFAANGLQILPSEEEESDQVSSAKSIYDFSATDIDGNVVSLNQYRNCVCLIVNVASQ